MRGSLQAMKTIIPKTANNLMFTETESKANAAVVKVVSVATHFYLNQCVNFMAITPPTVRVFNTQ